MLRTPAILALATAAAVSGCMDPSSAQTEGPSAAVLSAVGAPSPAAEQARDTADAPAAPTGGGTRRYAERIPFN